MRLSLICGQCDWPPFYIDGADMASWYHASLGTGAEDVTLCTPSPGDTAYSVVASVVVRAIATHPGDGLCTLRCKDETEKNLYRQLYNLWFAQTKDERL